MLVGTRTPPHTKGDVRVFAIWEDGLGSSPYVWDEPHDLAGRLNHKSGRIIP